MLGTMDNLPIPIRTIDLLEMDPSSKRRQEMETKLETGDSILAGIPGSGASAVVTDKRMKEREHATTPLNELVGYLHEIYSRTYSHFYGCTS